MKETDTTKKRNFPFKAVGIIFVLLLLCIVEFLPIEYTADERKNRLIGKAVPELIAAVLSFILLFSSSKGLFKKPERLVFVLPCLAVAINNFPFFSYFSGKSGKITADFADWLLFGTYAFGVGIFEEFVFRGFLLSLLVERFEKNKKGLWKTLIFSSLLFGGFHAFNLLFGGGVGATLLQICYSTLIGGMLAFVLFETKNILVPALLHGIYDFCGLLLDTNGLGQGVVFDLPTILLTAILGTAVGLFAIITVARSKDGEREEFYSRLQK